MFWPGVNSVKRKRKKEKKPSTGEREREDSSYSEEEKIFFLIIIILFFILSNISRPVASWHHWVPSWSTWWRLGIGGKRSCGSENNVCDRRERRTHSPSFSVRLVSCAAAADATAAAAAAAAAAGCIGNKGRKGGGEADERGWYSRGDRANRPRSNLVNANYRQSGAAVGPLMERACRWLPRPAHHRPLHPRSPPRLSPPPPEYT